MRSGNKASLCHYLTEGIPNANLLTEIVQVNDGQTLLCQIKSFLNTSFPIFITCTKNICTANSDTAMLCLMVMETVPPQKLCNIQIEVVKFRPALPSLR